MKSVAAACVTVAMVSALLQKIMAPYRISQEFAETRGILTKQFAARSPMLSER